MYSSHWMSLLIALTNAGRICAHDSPSSPHNLFKRIVYGPPPGPLGWNNPELYKAAFPDSTSASPPTQTLNQADHKGGHDAGGDHHGGQPHQQQQQQKQQKHEDNHQDWHPKVDTEIKAQKHDSGDRHSSGGNDNKQCGKSSAQCPPGCQMTIKFTSDSLGVPFTPGAGGHSDSDTTKDSCICMTGGSVRVNVGTTDPSKHSTLIEGNAAGLNDNSFFDVSYVEGYNYPVVCWNDNDPSRMSGHNVDLFAKGKCTSSGASKMGDICENDGYQKLVTGQDCWKCTLPSSFFEPAAGAAYTYPYDDCPCASDPQPGKKYQSPMANGGEITCCVGPNCCANTMSHGGQTRKGNCDRPDCRPCNAGFDWGHCADSCAGKPHSKRSYDRVLEQHSLRKRGGQHHHHHHHNH